MSNVDTAAIRPVRLDERLAQFDEFWAPRIVGELNGQQLKLAKFKGDFVQHQHEHQDELFMVLSGHLYIELMDRTVEVEAGQFVIIPRGVLHRPFAKQETHVLLLEPA
ncbi:MAG: cupin domain-containing protein, partial [Pseudomonadota bacterium]